MQIRYEMDPNLTKIYKQSGKKGIKCFWRKHFFVKSTRENHLKRRKNLKKKNLEFEIIRGRNEQIRSANLNNI